MDRFNQRELNAVEGKKKYRVEVSNRFGGVDWIGRAQDRDKWKTLVNAVLNLRVP
jgi:hypothetical protein